MPTARDKERKESWKILLPIQYDPIGTSREAYSSKKSTNDVIINRTRLHALEDTFLSVEERKIHPLARWLRFSLIPGSHDFQFRLHASGRALQRSSPLLSFFAVQTQEDQGQGDTIISCLIINAHGPIITIRRRSGYAKEHRARTGFRQ